MIGKPLGVAGGAGCWPPHPKASPETLLEIYGTGRRMRPSSPPDCRRDKKYLLMNSIKCEFGHARPATALPAGRRYLSSRSAGRGKEREPRWTDGEGRQWRLQTCKQDGKHTTQSLKRTQVEDKRSTRTSSGSSSREQMLLVASGANLAIAARIHQTSRRKCCRID